MHAERRHTTEAGKFQGRARRCRTGRSCIAVMKAAERGARMIGILNLIYRADAELPYSAKSSSKERSNACAVPEAETVSAPCRCARKNTVITV